MVLDAAKRVSLVTAVSPRALVDLAYVVFEAGRLIRRLAELYGGRPGTLGFFRLARGVLAHLAVTGAIAAGDELRPADRRPRPGGAAFGQAWRRASSTA